MNLIQRTVQALGLKDYNPANKEDRIFFSGIGSYSHKEFFRVSAALRAGFVISSGVGQMPINIEGEEEGGKLYTLLNDRPNELMTGVELREMITLHAVFTGTGRAFIRRRASTGQAIEIWPLHPTWTQSGWVYKDGKYVLPVTIENAQYLGEFTRDDIIEVTTPRWDHMQGVNVSLSCSNVLGLSTQLQDRQARLSDSKAPYGILTTPAGGSDGRVKALKEAWSKQFGQSGIAVVDFEANFTQMMQTASDQQLNETFQQQIEEVSRVYGVHPYFLMKTAGSGAQNAISDILLFHQLHTMGPWVVRWEAAIKRSLLNKTKFTANFNEKSLLRTTPKDKAEIHARALGSGGNMPWMTANDVRKEWGLDPHPDGDALLLPKQDAPAIDVKPIEEAVKGLKDGALAIKEALK